ncbi:hypothetical protein Tdes44962_MAKER00645 [Teratosphaeria destructans]|uniref:Uncharacterized protein n=1 Tax=Teratosphaeria destructans TaxID=418781 RepID=A0A9W7W0X7_9PEZI|nr:hypothetical protein Tdes44962_MAKER00645 [Teratosphaeria destructans]
MRRADALQTSDQIHVRPLTSCVARGVSQAIDDAKHSRVMLALDALVGKDLFVGGDEDLEGRAGQRVGELAYLVQDGDVWNQLITSWTSVAG